MIKQLQRTFVLKIIQNKAIAGDFIEYFVRFNGKLKSFNQSQGKISTAWKYNGNVILLAQSARTDSSAFHCDKCSHSQLSTHHWRNSIPLVNEFQTIAEPRIHGSVIFNNTRLHCVGLCRWSVPIIMLIIIAATLYRWRYWLEIYVRVIRVIHIRAINYRSLICCNGHRCN